MNKSKLLHEAEIIWKDGDLINDLREACKLIREEHYLSKGRTKQEAYGDFVWAFAELGIEQHQAIRDIRTENEKITGVTTFLGSITYGSKKVGKKYLPAMLLWIDKFHTETEPARDFRAKLGTLESSYLQQPQQEVLNDKATLSESEVTSAKTDKIYKFAAIATIVAMFATVTGVVLSLPKNSFPSIDIPSFIYPDEHSEDREDKSGEVDQNSVASAPSPPSDPKTSEQEDAPEPEEVAEVAQDKEDKNPLADVEKDTSKPPRKVNATWDKISSAQWSHGFLASFYPIIARTNKSDLLAAAEAGNANAQTLAAIGYHSGRLERTNHTKGIRLIRKACSVGQGRACTLMGVHYTAGYGVPANEDSAFRKYNQGCKLGSQIGCHYSAWRTVQREGASSRDIASGITRLRTACSAGMSYSCGFLSLYHGSGTYVEKDVNLADEYGRKACQFGWTSMC